MHYMPNKRSKMTIKMNMVWGITESVRYECMKSSMLLLSNIKIHFVYMYNKKQVNREKIQYRRQNEENTKNVSCECKDLAGALPSTQMSVVAEKKRTFQDIYVQYTQNRLDSESQLQSHEKKV